MQVDGTRIRTLRENNGQSIKDLANMASITKGYLSLIENDHRDPSPPVAARLAKALKVAIVDLRRDQ